MSELKSLENKVMDLANLSNNHSRFAKWQTQMADESRTNAEATRCAYRAAWFALYLKSSHRAFLKFMARCDG